MKPNTFRKTQPIYEIRIRSFRLLLEKVLREGGPEVLRDAVKDGEIEPIPAQIWDPPA